MLYLIANYRRTTFWIYIIIRFGSRWRPENMPGNNNIQKYQTNWYNRSLHGSRTMRDKCTRFWGTQNLAYLNRIALKNAVVQYNLYYINLAKPARRQRVQIFRPEWQCVHLFCGHFASWLVWLRATWIFWKVPTWFLFNFTQCRPIG